jgi:hypothetical protein
MKTYLATPGNALQAHAASGMPVLLSFACWQPWVEQYQPTFPHVLIDSGAYSELNSGKVVDLSAYVEFAARWEDRADAIAGLDDIRGNWRRSLRNYEQGVGFPTYHDSDPPELLPDLIDIARERGGWIGVGLLPPRQGKRRWVAETMARMPDDLHVHGWALRAYRDEPRLDSVDSTNWWRDAMALRTKPMTKHLTYGECLEIVVKRYQREARTLRAPQTQGELL